MTRIHAPQVSPTADWTADARFFEYTQAADPRVPAVPIAALASDPDKPLPTGIVPFDLSRQLGCDYPATTPNLLASFLRIAAHERLNTLAFATSQLFYVVKGSGRTDCEHGAISWSTGDLFVLPASGPVTHDAAADSTIYWVHDEPLMHYLGVRPTEPRFRPTLFQRERLMKELDEVANQPGAEKRNRRGILLGNVATPMTMTITHTLWSLLNVLPAGAVQLPHRHNSVALDLCIAAKPGTYTMIGERVENRRVVDGHRADWIPGAAFVTPPGLWHSHHNETGTDAMVLPIQDAGLCTYMRILDIQFA